MNVYKSCTHLETMNTIDLVKVLSKNKYTSKKFKGVFPRNHLPKHIVKPALIIANTDPSSKPGEHWVCFYIPKKGVGEYFDSFGDKPKNRQFIKFLNDNVESFVYSKKRIQSDFSSWCGQFCCVYMYYKCKGKKLNDFLRNFSNTDLISNDEKIIHMYTKLLQNKKNDKDVENGKRKRNQFGGYKQQFYCIQNCKSKK